MKPISLLTILTLFFTFNIGLQAQPKSLAIMGANTNKSASGIMDKILSAHGIANWKKQRTLSFTIPKGEEKEVHTIDIRNRKDRVVGNSFSMGFNGESTWILNLDDSKKRNPKLYHNLMFYFYAMPFVLADAGITYEMAEPIMVKGVSYPGIKISFADGIGASSKDNYFVHYNATTYKMEWLGYTFTFGSDVTSNKVNWIHYGEWQDVKGVLLPKSISWHNFKDGKIKEAKNTVLFNEVKLLDKVDASLSEIPEKAKIIE